MFILKRLATLFLVCTFMQAQPLPNVPTPQSDGYALHRGEDYAFGLLISTPVGFATKPWIGLLAGETAGIANEAHYGRNFNMVHLAVISAGALTGYGLSKWEKRNERRQKGIR
jgi:hypothetical protein